MSLTQKLARLLMPRSKFEQLEAESRSWIIHCPNGHTESIWDIGGLRGGAASKGKRILHRCPQCGDRGMHEVIKAI